MGDTSRVKLPLGCKLNLCPAEVQFWVNNTKILLVALLTPHRELQIRAQKEMLSSKAGIPSAKWTPAEEKETAVGYLSMRTNQPNPAPFPELLHDKVQKSCTSICEVQSTAGLEKSCQHHGSFWAASQGEMIHQVCGLPVRAHCCLIYYVESPLTVTYSTQ